MTIIKLIRLLLSAIKNSSVLFSVSVSASHSVSVLALFWCCVVCGTERKRQRCLFAAVINGNACHVSKGTAALAHPAEVIITDSTDQRSHIRQGGKLKI